MIFSRQVEGHVQLVHSLFAHQKVRLHLTFALRRNRKPGQTGGMERGVPRGDCEKMSRAVSGVRGRQIKFSPVHRFKPCPGPHGVINGSDGVGNHHDIKMTSWCRRQWHLTGQIMPVATSTQLRTYLTTRSRRSVP